ncbi:MAG: DUF72 domain-containing protein, partial [Candidatus Sigynarchaeota archaeon]
KNLPVAKQLEYYASVFDVVEVDSTFYTMPKPDIVEGWRKRTPEGFMFVPKLFKGISHDLHQAVAEKSLETLVDKYFEAIAKLGTKIAAILVQMPPGFRSRHVEDFFALLDVLPANIKHAIEFRDASWFTDVRVLDRIERQGNVSIAGSIHPAVEPFVRKTADFYVFRFIGNRELDRFGAIQRDKQRQMEEIKHRMDVELQDVRDTFVFFNNHYAGFGPASVNLFREMIGMKPATFGGAGKNQKTLGDFLG